jgi:two-component system NarL family response regulator
MMQSSIFCQDSAVSSNDNHRQVSPVRVLVVDDFAPFRRLVCSMITKTPEFHVVAEASDGEEAVQKAGELQPDLIFLDISLPKLNGIAAARQMRTLTPKAKIVFVTQEFSPDVAQEAFSAGAMAYVVKIYAGTDLPAAVDAALEGKQFRSAAISRQAR